MHTTGEVVTSFSHDEGWARWITSGGECMAWDEPDCTGFFTIDIYTCKPFSNEVAVEFTWGYWNSFDDAWDPILAELAA
jgi:hypothetical protein